jgi:hypothetical protein
VQSAEAEQKKDWVELKHRLVIASWWKTGKRSWLIEDRSHLMIEPSAEPVRRWSEAERQRLVIGELGPCSGKEREEREEEDFEIIE